MNSNSIGKPRESNRTTFRISVALIATGSLLTAGCGSGFFRGQHPTSKYRSIDTHMSEQLRSTIRTVTVQPSAIAPTLIVTGDYGKAVPTAGEGASAGAGAGVKMTGEMISEDPRALLIAPIILPIAIIAGAIIGASAAKVQQQLQKFRDKLTTEITEENATTLPADVLAKNLHSHLEGFPDIDTTLVAADAPVRMDTDAILEVRVTELTITVNGNDAIMAMTAVANLRRTTDNTVLYNKTYSFRKKDSLRNWSEDDNALWDIYVEQAQHHFTRQISGDFFEKITLRHVLRPTKSDRGTGRDDWSKSIITASPTFTWELFLLGGDAYEPWAEEIDASNATYELEIYHHSELVYAAADIATLDHQVREPLARCKTYRWSVRPTYRINGRSRVGEWMSYLSSFDSVFRSPTSSTRTETPDFWQGFAKFDIRCR